MSYATSTFEKCMTKNSMSSENLNKSIWVGFLRNWIFVYKLDVSLCHCHNLNKWFNAHFFYCRNLWPCVYTANAHFWKLRCKHFSSRPAGRLVYTYFFCFLSSSPFLFALFSASPKLWRFPSDSFSPKKNCINKWILFYDRLLLCCPKQLYKNTHNSMELQ